MIRIPVDEGEMSYVQMLYYELMGLRVLLQQVLRTGRPSNDIFERYMERYTKTNTEYHLAFNEFIKRYAAQYQDGTHTYNIDFAMAEIVVMEVPQC